MCGALALAPRALAQPASAKDALRCRDKTARAGLNYLRKELRPELVRLLAGIPAKINLIPFNPWPGAPYECSDWERIEAFADVVNRAGYASPVRTPRGRDIMAACGQLKSESVKERTSARMAALRSAELARMPH